MTTIRSLAIFCVLIVMPSVAVAQEVQEAAVDSTAFEQLFNGEDLTGWTGDTAGYAVEDAAIVCLPGQGGNLYYDREFSDFTLRLEFKLDPGANNGIGIRAEKGQNAAYHGMEIQVIDNGADRWRDIEPWQKHGSVYGVVPAKTGYLRPPGEWNEQEIDARGTHITVTLNGQVIVDADLVEASAGGTVDGQDHPGLLRPSGYIGLLGHGDRVAFRNIRIRTRRN